MCYAEDLSSTAQRSYSYEFVPVLVFLRLFGQHSALCNGDEVAIHDRGGEEHLHPTSEALMTDSLSPEEQTDSQTEQDRAVC